MGEARVEESFAEIDAAEFERAKNDPRTKRLAEAADRHLATLREEGRIDNPVSPELTEEAEGNG